MMLIDSVTSSLPSSIIRLHPKHRQVVVMERECFVYISVLLHGQRDKKPIHPSHIVLTDKGESNNNYKIQLQLFGEPSNFYPLRGKIHLKGFIEEEYDYDIRYLYEMTADRMIANGIATTVREQEYPYYKNIAEDCGSKGLDFVQMCNNTLKFTEDIKEQKSD